MDRPMDVCVLVGSLRKASFNGILANALISLAPSSIKLDIVGVGQLPLYNEDLETAAPPAPWTAFRRRVKALTQCFSSRRNIIVACRRS